MPDVEQWRKVRAILQEALELPPDARGPYLERACGSDDALRTEVESLLKASEQSAFLDRPALASAAGTITMDSFPSPSLLKPGATLSHYQIVRKIGEGGMGEVYQAVDQHLGRTVALKIIRNDGESPRRQARFVREAKAASALNHPNIVTIYEFDRAGGIDFLAMEYLEGVTLTEMLSKRNPGNETLAKLLEYSRQAAAAIGAAHAAGIVHRDLKPGNLMIAPNGTVKVLDFGLAKQPDSADPEEKRDLSLTQTGVLVGTPAYMSPEQVLGEPVGPASDVFSFGIILYEIACG